MGVVGQSVSVTNLSELYNNNDKLEFYPVKQHCEIASVGFTARKRQRQNGFRLHRGVRISVVIRSSDFQKYIVPWGRLPSVLFIDDSSASDFVKNVASEPQFLFLL